MRSIFISVIFIALCANASDLKENSILRISELNFGFCHFKVSDPFKGRLRVYANDKPPAAAYIGPLVRDEDHSEISIRFTCNDSSPKTLALRAGVRLQEKNWVLADAATQGSTDEDLNALKTTLVKFGGDRWVGIGMTQDQSSGDEDLRARSFLFCIPHGALALCGSAESVAQLNNLKESSMPNIIKLLESIEFIDDETASVPGITDKH